MQKTFSRSLVIRGLWRIQGPSLYESIIVHFSTTSWTRGPGQMGTEMMQSIHLFVCQAFRARTYLSQGILKGEVSLYHWPPCLPRLESAVWQLTIFVFIFKTDLSEPIKQEVNGTVILPPFSIPCLSFQNLLRLLLRSIKSAGRLLQVSWATAMQLTVAPRSIQWFRGCNTKHAKPT